MTLCRRTFLLLAFGLILFSCKKGEESSSLSGQGRNGDRPLIGFSMDTLVVDRWRKDRDAVTRVFEERGMDILIRDARNSGELQKQQAAELVEKGIDLLLIIPHDSASSAEAVIPAQKRGIPVISYDRLIEKAGTDAYISFDNHEVGRLIMEELLSRVPQGRYVILNGAPGDHNSFMLREGASRALAQHDRAGEVAIAGETWAEDWSSDYTYGYISQLLARGEPFDAVWAANDSLAGSVVRALSEHQLSGRIAVGGQDADLDACQRVVEGTQTLTIYKPIDQLAAAAADLAEALLGKTPLPAPDDLIHDGLSNIPYYRIGVQKVVKENMLEVIVRNGFHPEDLIYQNVLPPEE